jgi:hypothetical protein
MQILTGAYIDGNGQYSSYKMQTEAQTIVINAAPTNLSDEDRAPLVEQVR